ncbi:multidrug transporter [Photobacterium leiognathi]|uniref:multidrug transporter n=1 Tax=Photobacterium leiognathi TaxID=553611 RepID=UPI002981E312|nr:multidrug transporter [Photobacterium leiognathi]
MESKFFKVSALTAAMLGAVAMPATAEEMDVSSPVIQEEIAFFNDSTISGNFNLWMRERDRGGYDEAAGKPKPQTTNLDHGSVFVNLGFNSGYIADTVGLDLVVYSTFDMWQNGGADHEMNFWDVNNPYDKEARGSCSNVWTDCNDNGVSFATANAKFKFGENVTAKAGYFQPSVPSTLGVNWSFAPGTYLGGEIGANIGDLALGAVYATEYKAPWFKNTYKFQTTDGEDAGDVYSLGARYAFANGISIDAGFGGLTEGDRKNGHLKVKGTTDSGLYWSPQLYIVHDKEQYDSTAYQLAFLSSYATGPYTVRAEATYTSADSGNSKSVGNMAYRLTSQYGGSNGAYEIWWNNRSDFNHDEEAAVFGSLSRDFSDIGATGLNAGLSAAYGFGAKAEGYDELKEYAFSLFTSYAIQSGALQDANVSMHFTKYYNDSNADNWSGYSNGFQDETDFKLVLAIPFNVK